MTKISQDINYHTALFSKNYHKSMIDETREEKERLQKLLDRAKKANWEGVINDILNLAKRRQIELKN